MTWQNLTRDEVRREIQDLDAEYRDRAMDAAAVRRWNDLNELLDQMEIRSERLRELAEDERNLVEVSPAPRPAANLGRTRDEVLRTIHRYSDELSDEAAVRLDGFVREEDKSGIDSAYLTAVGNPHYRSAFGKIIFDPTFAHLRFTPEESEAIQVVNRVGTERGMTVGTGSQGGFALPFTLDPSVLLTSSGALNPIRSVARQITVSTDQWKGVSSTGVTASYDAEAAEVSDDTPTLAQPVIDCAMGRAFVPYSIEIGQDWDTLSAELGRLISDARDVLDATQFLTGSGTDSPAGVLTGLTTSQRVQDATTGFPAVGDHYALKAAIPARFLAGSNPHAPVVAVLLATRKERAADSIVPPKERGPLPFVLQMNSF
jgi:HK97 family phage major capsid protein